MYSTPCFRSPCLPRLLLGYRLTGVAVHSRPPKGSSHRVMLTWFANYGQHAEATAQATAHCFPTGACTTARQSCNRSFHPESPLAPEGDHSRVPVAHCSQTPGGYHVVSTCWENGTWYSMLGRHARLVIVSLASANRVYSPPPGHR